MKSRLLCCFLIISVLLIAVPIISDKPLQSIPDADGLLPKNLDSTNIIQKVTGQFYANHGQINRSDLLYYGYLSNGIVEIKETTISYRDQNQEYLVFDDIRNPRGIQESAYTTNFLLGSRGEYKLVKSYERIIFSLTLDDIDISLGIENGSLDVNIVDLTSIDDNTLKSMSNWIDERIHLMTEVDVVQQAPVPSESIFVPSSSNLLLFSTYLGGPGIDGSDWYGVNAVSDDEGNCYITTHTTYPGYPSSFDIQNSHSDCCIMKVNSSGNLEYVTFIGGSDDDRGVDIDVDERGNLYVIGTTDSQDFPLLNPMYDAMNGTTDIFILSFDSTGTNLRYSSYFPLGPEGPVLSLTVDKDECMYVAGRGASFSSFPLVNPCEEAYVTTTSSFLMKINYTGTELLYSTLFGIDSPTINDVAFDLEGNAYICGSTYSSELPTKNAIDSTYGGKLDAFICKFNPTGNGLEYCTYFGDDENDVATTLAVDHEGFLIVGGYASANNFEITYSFGTNNFRRDIYILKLNPDGNLVFSTQIGGFQNDVIYDMDINSVGAIYATGYTGSEGFPTINAYDSNHNGGNEDWEIWDCFVFKLNSTGNCLEYSTYVGGNDAEGGNSISVEPNGCVTVVGRTHSMNFPMVNPIDDSHEDEEYEDLFVFKLADATNDSTSPTTSDPTTIPTNTSTIEYPQLIWLSLTITFSSISVILVVTVLIIRSRNPT